MEDASPRLYPVHRRLLMAALLVGILARASLLLWDQPWTPHHPDEHVLALEAVALWEGVTPREVGWPAATTRLAISGMAGLAMLADTGPAVWQNRSRPEVALARVSHWIGEQYSDQATLFKLGRLVAFLTGLALLCVTPWMLRQWGLTTGVVTGTFAVAVAPLLVEHAQYVLADEAGLVMAMVVVGLAARPTPSRVVQMALWVGLASASKFHFGVWLLTPLVTALSLRGSAPSRRLVLILAAVAVTTATMCALVPWFWTSPVLAMKEFGGVVLSKVGDTPSGDQWLKNLPVVLGGLGLFGLAGGALGLARLPQLGRHSISVALPGALAALALARSAIVFDRYALVLAPLSVLLTALGWEWAWSVRRDAVRRVFQGVALVTGVLTFAGMVDRQRIAGEADVDVLLRGWILAHVPRGQTIFVYDENNAPLPRTPDALARCAAYVTTAEAYREKLLVLGSEPMSTTAEPFRSVLLNDEMFAAYWCRREAEVSDDPGYRIVTYHNGPRFGSLLEADVVAQWRAGPSGVLVFNRPVDVGVSPTATLATRRGQRVIYVP